MEYDVANTTDQIRQLNLTGNIIPHTWYSKITFPNGKPDLLGTIILAEIIYWWRPIEIKDERTGRLLGYKKKFAADMLQRSISSFADQFGSSKRQVADALKRLEDAGLIIREMRTIETSQGKIGNVQYLAPIVAAIKALDSDPKDNQLFSDDEKAKELVEIPDKNLYDAPPITFKRDRGHVETLEGSRSNVIGPTFERSTYTKNTTKITTENTAAREQIALVKLPSNDFDNKKLSAAASFSNKTNEKKSSSVRKPNVHPTADTVIGKSLTDYQKQCIEKAAASMSGYLGCDQPQLAIEIEHVILSSQSFTHADGDFFKKLNTIKKYIKENGWCTPASMTIEKAKQESEKIYSVKEEVKEAEMDYCHWKKMLDWAFDIGDAKKISEFQGLFNQAKQNLNLAMKKINSVMDASNTDMLGVIV